MTVSTVTRDDIFSKPPGIVTRNIGGETLLVPVTGKLADMQRLFFLDPTSEFIWQRINGTTTVRAILDSVTDAFDVDPPTAESDLLEFMAELVESGLIVKDE